VATDSKPTYEITSPLLSCVSQTALDAIFGAAALVDTNQNLHVLSRNWNEFMAGSGRADLTKNSVLGSSLLQFFRDEQQRQVFKNLLESMANDELGTHNQVVDLGQKDHPYYVQFHVQPIWNNGLHLGYFLHCLDATKEHTTRLTLIDHDRQLLKLKQELETNESELNAAKELLGSVAREQAEKDDELEKLREKAARKEKALKAAIKQAELSAGSMADKNRDIERLRADGKRLETELSAALGQLKQTAEELQTREVETATLREEYDSLCKESTAINEQLAESNKLQEERDSLQSEIVSLNEKLAAVSILQEENDSLKSDIASLREQLAAEDALQEENDSLQNEVTALKEKIAASESDDSQAEKKLEKVELSNAQLEQDIAEIDKERLALHVDLSNLRTELATAQEKYNLLSETLRTTQLQAESAQSQADLNSGLAESLSYSARQFGERLCELFCKESSASFSVFSLLERDSHDYLPIAEYDAPQNLKQSIENNLSFDLAENDLSVYEIIIRNGDRDLARVQLYYAEDAEEPGSAVAEKLYSLADRFEPLVEIASQLVNSEQLKDSAETAPVVEQSASPIADIEKSDTHGIRALSSDLANAFGDLLTAVIGHASLAAADADDNSPSLSDIRAIEMSAGEAAKLVRKLHALSGDARHAADAELTSSVTGFLKRNYSASDQGVGITFENAHEKIHVAVDHAALEVILKGIASFADSVVYEDSQPIWKLLAEDESVKLCLSFSGEASIPAGWSGDNAPHCDDPGYELFFAREAARAFGGELDIQTSESSMEIILSLPKALATVDNG
jgi:myosin heavy subunit